MNKLHIIFANRKDCFEKPGGDTVQMNKTKEYLEKKYPIEINICTNPDDFKKYPYAKIVHIFNLETINETNAFINQAKKLNKKVVLSTIHWNFLDTYYVKYLEFLNLPPIQTLEIFKIALIKLFNLFILLIPQLRKKYTNYIDKGLYCTNKYKKERVKALKDADLLLPNSDNEMELCAKDFGLSFNYIKNKAIVIPNATDFSISNVNNANVNKLNLPEKYVLIAGRIDSTKNQYNIIRALMNDTDIGIVIVGNPYSSLTNDRIRKLAKKRKNVFILNQIPQEKLVAIYKNAICHCLPSFYDTTGLVNLEALLCGCPIVVSNYNHCPVEYYEFDRYGKVCDPYNLESIKENIMYYVKNPTKVKVSDEYRYKISYENVAHLTFKAYENLLKEI